MWRILILPVVLLVSCKSTRFLEPEDHKTSLVLAREADGTISTRITNTSESTIALVRHWVPSETLSTPLFAVESDGEKLPYYGIIAEPGFAFNPDSNYLSSAEFVLLTPGQSHEAKTSVRGLRKDFALPPGAAFTVRFDSVLPYAVVKRPVERIKYVRINQSEVKQSNVLSFP